MKYCNSYILSVLLPLLLLTASCRDDMPEGGGAPLQVEEGIPGTLTLSVSTDDGASHVVTRATREEEQTISSLYVFVIDANDTNHRVLSRKWFPGTENVSRDASGKLTIDIPAASCSSVRIFAISNLNTANQLANDKDILKKLHNALTEAELEAITVELDKVRNSELSLVDRLQGSLVASGHYCCVHQNQATGGTSLYPLYTEGETFALVNDGGNKLVLQHATAGSNPEGTSWNAGEPVNGSIWLHHLDAKINFEVKLGKNLPAGSYFKLKSWKVKNLQTVSFLHWQKGSLSSDDQAKLGNTDDLSGSYIDETNEDGSLVCKFSFYTFESRKQTAFSEDDVVAKMKECGFTDFTTFSTADAAYSLREKKENNGSFKYAPEDAAYVILKGEYYNPKVELSGTTITQERVADVVYIIHLGYIGNGNTEESTTNGNTELNKLNDYRILRNSSYTYKVTVLGVDNIRLEAERVDQPEKQPAAEGSVTDSDFDLQADAHYEQRLIRINVARLSAGLTSSVAKAGFSYTVHTPFSSRQVAIDDVNGTDDRPLMFDDGWVHFAYLGNDANGGMSTTMQARMAEGAGYGLPYTYTYDHNPDESSASNPVKLWSSLTLLQNLRTWVNTYDKAIESGRTVNSDDPANPYILLDGGLKFYLMRYFTVYVDEYYYTEDPTTGTTSNTLWTHFCNADDRTMSIFQGGYESSDGHSHFNRSGMNIRQRSIQTLYAPLQTGQQLANVAYGIEHTDEYGGNYNFDSARQFPFTSGSTLNNGLENTLRGLWNNTDLVNRAIGGFDWKGAYNAFPFDERTSEAATASTANRAKRFANVAALSRNRDNNRNGVIDPEELLWYVPAQRQMMNLYLGSFLMSEPLYLAKLLKGDKICYATSTSLSPVSLCFLVASEGASLRWINGMSTDDLKNCYVRCARNLGTPPVLQSSAPFTGSYKHEELATISPVPANGNTNVSCTITYNRYNLNGMRSYIDFGALGSHNPFQSAARPYHSFITAKQLLYWNGRLANLTEARSLCNKYAEEADHSDQGMWRLPNSSEALAMLLYITPASMWDTTAGRLMWTGTHSAVNSSDYVGISFNEQDLKCDPFTGGGYVRCVRDNRGQ
ncbi:MAG: fimbrial protein [Parabacteroides sp.]|nr:fimbrial protein [Parabacteroides sp.]